MSWNLCHSRGLIYVASLFLLPALIAGVAAADLTDGLVGYYPLDEGAGDIAYDMSGTGHDGTLHNGVTWIAQGYDGGGVHVDGTANTRIELGTWNPAAETGRLSLALWIRWTGGGGTYQGLIGKRDTWPGTTMFQFQVRPENGGTFRLETGSYAIVSPNNTLTPYIQTWAHVAATFDGTTCRLYLNGDEVASGVFAFTAAGAGSNMGIGCVTGGGAGYSGNGEVFSGDLDEVCIFNRALSAQEIPLVMAGVSGDAVPQAYAPIPANGMTGFTQSWLQWTAGAGIAYHNVYLGTSPDLTEADRVAENGLHAMYFHNAGLTPGTTYYWRVDEVAADGVTIYPGELWSFSTAPATAFAPNPRNGDKWIDPDTALAWSAGFGAITHDLYFSTDVEAVTNRDAGVQVLDRKPATTYVPSALELGTTYYWVVDEHDAFGAEHEGEVWRFTTTDGTGGGVKAEYFDNVNLTGTPVLTRTESEINFAWGTESPDSAVPVDYFSARWTADLEIAIADEYTFIATTDDGARVYLDGELIVDQWVDQGATDAVSPALHLEPGIYSLQMEYFENAGGASAQLSWRSSQMARQIIPAGPLQLPLRASAVYPRAGDVNVPHEVTLTWGPGDRATGHQVYFGDDRDAVADATPADAAVYCGYQDLDATGYAVGDLEWNKTYYWRVDEVNDAEADSPWKGSVWRFRTADFIVVDNCESYTNDSPNRVFQTWVDGLGFSPDEHFPDGGAANGTGALVGHDIWTAGSEHYNGEIVETLDVHGGGQALPLYYDNASSPFYSEAVRTWATPQDWTVNGVTDLSLWFRGYPAGLIQTGANSFTMSASGTDIWDIADEFRFVYKQLSGDGAIVARVDSLANTNGWAKAGVMIRESLHPGSPHAMTVATPEYGISFGRRIYSDESTSQHSETDVVAPHWVKITRTGNTLTAEHSSDGVTWVSVGADVDASSVTIEMINNVYIGLCLTSHNADAVTVAEFSEVQTSGGVSGSWQMEEVGVDHPENGLTDLYVALEDSGGRIATVSYPQGATVNAWTQWEVPLADFVGVDVTAIEKMILGVGDRNAPTSDDTGVVLFDDIHVTKPDSDG